MESHHYRGWYDAREELTNTLNGQVRDKITNTLNGLSQRQTYHYRGWYEAREELTITENGPTESKGVCCPRIHRLHHSMFRLLQH